ncbi:MAG: hypothetical protein METHAR1v1_310010 [Methanothrix sp.]|nr:MAG: hypothetical protein METHAR1v1_310010 [Methanothrix sp.]
MSLIIWGRELLCGPVSIGAGADLLSAFDALDAESDISRAGLFATLIGKLLPDNFHYAHHLISRLYSREFSVG